MNDRVTGNDLLAAATGLSDDTLLARVEDLARTSRQVTVELLVHLGELERRKLHRGQGYGRLFLYCTEVLKFSEYSAYHRLQAARAARRFPLVLELLASGRVNLTTVRLLAPHLTEENHRSLLEEAAGLKRREVDKIVARLNPQADVPSSIRKLPTPRTPMTWDAGATDDAAEPDAGTAPAEAASGEGVSDIGDTSASTPAPACAAAGSGGTRVATSSAKAGSVAARRGTLEPLRPSRYKLEVTLGEEEHDDIRWLQDAMRREIPDGDPAVIVRRALKAWRAEIEKKRFCATTRPKPAMPPTPGSRHIPADVQRKVWARDDGRCAFVAQNGRRCGERSYLEFHHRDPYVIGGEAIVANISLRCRAHNVYEAEMAFGAVPVTRGPAPAKGMSGRAPTGAPPPASPPQT